MVGTEAQEAARSIAEGVVALQPPGGVVVGACGVPLHACLRVVRGPASRGAELRDAGRVLAGWCARLPEAAVTNGAVVVYGHHHDDDDGLTSEKATFRAAVSQARGLCLCQQPSSRDFEGLLKVTAKVPQARDTGDILREARKFAGCRAGREPGRVFGCRTASAPRDCGVRTKADPPLLGAKLRGVKACVISRRGTAHNVGGCQSAKAGRQHTQMERLGGTLSDGRLLGTKDRRGEVVQRLPEKPLRGEHARAVVHHQNDIHISYWSRTSVRGRRRRRGQVGTGHDGYRNAHDPRDRLPSCACLPG